MNFKKLLPILLGTTLTAGIVTYNRIQQPTEKSVTIETSNSTQNTPDHIAPASTANFAQDYNKQLAQEEQEVWRAMEQECEFSLAACQRLKKEYHQYYLQDLERYKKNAQKRKPLSAQTVTFVEGILDEFGIDKKQITIVPYDDDSPAAAHDTMILINEPLMAQLSPNARKFVIGHEICHIINKDDSTNHAVFNKIKDHSGRDHPVNQLTRFQEKRADMQAALKGPEYAEGQVTFIQHMYEKFGPNPGISHPKHTDRIAMGQEIINTMNQQGVVLA